ncbi:MAG: tetratricopeptide repeat protein [Bacteroidales bacterium]
MKMRSVATGILIVLAFLNGLLASAQTLKEAYDEYNAAIALLETDKAAAIQQFEKAVSLCEAIGPEADSLKMGIVGNLPSLYYDLAYDSYKNKKMEEALARFQKTVEVAKKYGDEKTQKKAEDVEPQLYYAIGTQFYKDNNFDKALENLNEAVKLDPAFARAWLVIGLIYRKKEDINQVTGAMDKAIESAKADNDVKTADQAKKVARDFLLIKANQENKKQNYSQALDYLNKALEYDDQFSDIYYLFAVIYNKQSKWQDAVNAGEKGLKTAAPADAGKIQFELGTAYMGLNQNEKACSAFREALKDKNCEASAKYYIEQKLKCQ